MQTFRYIKIWPSQRVKFRFRRTFFPTYFMLPKIWKINVYRTILKKFWDLIPPWWIIRIVFNKIFCHIIFRKIFCLSQHDKFRFFVHSNSPSFWLFHQLNKYHSYLISSVFAPLLSQGKKFCEKWYDKKFYKTQS